SSLYVLDQGISAGDCALTHGALTRVPLDGGMPESLISTLYGVSNFTLAGGKAYIATGVSCGGEPPNGTLQRIPLAAGSSATTLARGAWLPTSLVVDGAHLYGAEDSWPGSFPSAPGQPYGGGILRVGD